MSAQAPAARSASIPEGRVQNPYAKRPSWVYPAMVVVVFSAFILYASWVVLFESGGRAGAYLSPFFSPEINVRVGGFLIPPAIWVAWAPLAFRLTCYYYRKAYFRGFFQHPNSCAAPDSADFIYNGETRFWLFNNFHRFAFYAIFVQTVILWYDAVAALSHGGSLSFGVGNAIMLINVVCLTAYTLGCHALRHLAGGGADCFSCNRTRHTLWKGVSVLNMRHEAWAWISMFSVWATDLYIRLGVHGVLQGGWY